MSSPATANVMTIEEALVASRLLVDLARSEVETLSEELAQLHERLLAAREQFIRVTDLHFDVARAYAASRDATKEAA